MSARRRILITGLHGTVAPYVAKAAEKQGYHVVSWSRDIVDPTSLGDANMFLFRMNLDAIVHCASGPEVWGGIMAHFAAKNNIPFLFTSSVMVFSDRREGPYGIFLHFALKICLFFPIHSTIPIKFIPRMLFGNFALEVQGSYFVDR